MPLLMTPRQLRHRSELYRQFGSLTQAGMGLIQACELLSRNPPARSFRAPLQTALGELQRGQTFTEALGRLHGWLPEFDVALLRAGEQSGRLDSCFQILAAHYEERAQLLRQMLADLAWPVFVLHFAVFILPFPTLFANGDVRAYLLSTFGLLLPIYAVIFLLLLACQGRHGEAWRALVERVGRLIPVLGKARHELALARLAAALEALVNAGVNIIEAWQMAAAASGSPRLRRVVALWVPGLQAGRTPAEAVQACAEFPEAFASLYATGEVTGNLDDTLRRLHVLLQENASRKMRALALWLPRLFYLAVCLLVGWRIVSFWTNYYSGIFNSANF